MTQRVRTGYRNHRRASWAAALAVATAAALAALAVVLPALGAAGDQILPASDRGVIPTDVPVGGSNFSCTTNTGGQPPGMSSFSVPSPPNSASPVTYNSTNSTLPTGVSLTLTGFNQAAKKGKFFNFTMTGANVFHAAVKGGNDVAWYDYFDHASTSGGVQSDGNLHATLKDATNLYNASYTTFCFAQTTTISGKVYLDNNGDGTFNTSSTPPDVGQNGWTVKLFTSAGVQVGSSLTTPSPNSDPAGSYTFTGVPIGGNYKVCEIPPSGSWDQTAPNPAGTWSSTACSTVSGTLPGGRVITNLPAAGASGQDFGNEQTVTPFCNTTFGPAPGSETAGSIVEYKAQFTNPQGGTDCKAAVVMYATVDGSQPYAIIHQSAGGGTNYWVVERIRMMVDKNSAQNPVTLKYDDTNPYGGGNGYATMKMCKSDPRATGSLFHLAMDPASVMPDATADNGDPETSCMIVSTDLPSDGITEDGVTFNYEVYVATDVDGIKQPT